MTKWQQEDSAAYLLSAVGAHIKIRFTDMLEPFGLQPQHFGVLHRIADNDGITQQETADAMHLRRSVMVGLVDDLEAKGWIERRRHPTDRRANALHLTAAGKHVLTRCQRTAHRLDADICGGIPDTERGQFLRHLRTLAGTAGVAEFFPVRPDDDRRTSRPA